jgi:hypothetical protein
LPCRHRPVSLDRNAFERAHFIRRKFFETSVPPSASAYLSLCRFCFVLLVLVVAEEFAFDKADSRFFFGKRSTAVSSFFSFLVCFGFGFFFSSKSIE